MPDFVIPPPPSLPFLSPAAARSRSPRVCVGRNYAEHAREMGSDPDREPPFFFMKPADALLLNDCRYALSAQQQRLHTKWNWSLRSANLAASCPGRRHSPDMAQEHRLVDICHATRDQFHFVVQIFAAGRIGHIGIVQQQRVGGLHEEERRLAIRIAAHLTRVLGVVAADAKHAANGERAPPATGTATTAGGGITKSGIGDGVLSIGER